MNGWRWHLTAMIWRAAAFRWKKLRELADLPETQLIEFDVQIRQAVIDCIRRRRAVTPAIKRMVEDGTTAGSGQDPVRNGQADALPSLICNCPAIFRYRSVDATRVPTLSLSLTCLY